MVEDVDIDSLIIDRPIRTGPVEVQAALEQSIKKVGIQQPLVARPDHVVIDGVRRIAAAKNLGITHVPVVVTSDFDLVVETMTSTLKDGLHAVPADHYRAWYLYQVTRPILAGVGSRLRRWKKTPGMAGVVAKKNNDTAFSQRVLLGEAIGYHQGKLQQAVFLLARVWDPTHPDHEHALKVLEQVDRGELTVYSAGPRVQFLRRRLANPSYEEQWSILTNSVVTMGASVKALQGILEVHDKFTAEELDRFIDTFMKDRFDLYQVIKKLRRKRGEK